MVTTFYMPARIVAGQGSLATIGTLARDLKMSRVLLVSDPVISQQPFLCPVALRSATDQ